MCNPSRALVLELRHEDEFNHDGSVDVAVTGSVGDRSVDVAVTSSVGVTCGLYKKN